MTDFKPSGAADWETQLAARLPLYGHRNWIVVADAAYPAQSAAGIETVVADAEQLVVLKKVAGAIAQSRHIRANVYIDHELAFVAENDAAGVDEYKLELDTLFAKSTLLRLPHEEIIQKLDLSARFFRILIIKTNLKLPYTSVFLELDCGYWNYEAEQRLREAIVNWTA